MGPQVQMGRQVQVAPSQSKGPPGLWSVQPGATALITGNMNPIKSCPVLLSFH